MTAIIKVVNIVLDIVYGIIKCLPTMNKVTMLSRQSDVPSVEFIMIKDEIEKRDRRIKVVLLCKTLDGGINSSIGNKVKYCFHMLVQMIHIATSKVVILDSYCIVVSMLHHKKDLKVIQMWHSMGTMKKFGYSALGTQEGSRTDIGVAMKMHRNYDYIFASSDAYKEHLAKGFDCDIGKIITMPLPRLDLLQSETYLKEISEKIYDKYPEIQKKPTILYCPTFRKDEKEFERAVYELVEATDPTKYNLVVKLHPLSKVNLSDSVIQAKEFSSFDMLFVADYVVSDYSCIIYEAAVLNIPLFFYNFDMDLYTVSRGLAIDYEKELPGVISGSARGIISAIESGEYDMEELRRFSEKYIEPTQNATGNIVDFIWKYLD